MGGLPVSSFAHKELGSQHFILTKSKRLKKTEKSTTLLGSM